MHKFQDLSVYQKSLDFTVVAREVCSGFPKDELYVLSAQFKRAADSISLNISEGAGDSSDKEFVRFLGYSIRSAFECIGCSDIALRNKYIDQEKHSELCNSCNELIAMLYSLQKHYRG